MSSNSGLIDVHCHVSPAGYPEQKTGGSGAARGCVRASRCDRCIFESNVYDPAYLRHLAEQIAPEHVFLGTDYPYLIMQDAPRAFLESAGLSASALVSVGSGAALAFLGDAV